MRTAMKNRKTFVSTVVIARVLITLAIACALCGRAVAQTAGGTVISNQASATYSDGTNSYSTVSNTVTVTVSNVSGLAITPDAGSNPTDRKRSRQSQLRYSKRSSNCSC